MPVGDSVEAFGVLGDETRVAIIEALVEANRESPTNSSLSFSELRDRTGIGDSGRFNYHLEKLVGRFVERVEDGYRLSYTGTYVAGAVLSGFAQDAPATIDSHELAPCPVCETTLEAVYADGILRVGCANNHMFANWVSPRAFNDRDIESVVELAAVRAIGRLRQAQRGSCPMCFGHVAWELVPSEDDSDSLPKVSHRGQCQACGVPYMATPGTFVVWAPAVQAALYAHGVNVWEAPARWFIKCEALHVDSVDIPMGHVTVSGEIDPVSLTAVVDERGDLREVDIHEADSA